MANYDREVPKNIISPITLENGVGRANRIAGILVGIITKSDVPANTILTFQVPRVRADVERDDTYSTVLPDDGSGQIQITVNPDNYYKLSDKFRPFPETFRIVANNSSDSHIELEIKIPYTPVGTILDVGSSDLWISSNP
jgi:hypothetical protein